MESKIQLLSYQGIPIILSPRPTVSTGIVVRINVGKTDEVPDTYGAAHLVEHLIFEGSESYPNESLEYAVESTGGYISASSDNYETIIRLRVPSDQIENMFLRIVDAVLHPELNLKSYLKEKKVIKREVSVEDKDLLYQGISVIRKHLKIERDTNVPVLPLEKVSEFHKEFFIPENICVSIVGLVPNSFFSILQPCEKYLKKNTKSIMVPQYARWFFESEGEEDLVLYSLVRPLIESPEDWIKAYIMEVSIAGMLSSPFVKELRDTCSVYHVSNSTYHMPSGSLYLLSGYTNTGNGLELLNQFKEYIQNVSKNSVAENTYQDAVRYFRGWLGIVYEKPERLANDLCMSFALTGSLLDIPTLLNQLKKSDKNTIKDALNRYDLCNSMEIIISQDENN